MLVQQTILKDVLFHEINENYSLSWPLYALRSKTNECIEVSKEETNRKISQALRDDLREKKRRELNKSMEPTKTQMVLIYIIALMLFLRILILIKQISLEYYMMITIRVNWLCINLCQNTSPRFEKKCFF